MMVRGAREARSALRTARRVSLRLFGETPKKARACGWAYVTPAIAYSPVIQRSSRETTDARASHLASERLRSSGLRHPPVSR